MMGFIVAVIYFALALIAVGTVLAFLTSWRDGCLGKDLRELKTGLAWVFLRIKNFAHVIFNRRVYGHIRGLWMYYALIVMFIVAAASG